MLNSYSEILEKNSRNVAKNRNEKNKKTNGIETGLFGENDKMISSWVEKILKGGKYIYSIKILVYAPF